MAVQSREWITILWMCFFTLNFTSAVWTRGSEVEMENSPVIVFLTVSSLASSSEQQTDRMLELNWDRLPADSADRDAWIRLYDEDPVQHRQTEPLLSIRPRPEGYFRKGIVTNLRGVVKKMSTSDRLPPDSANRYAWIRLYDEDPVQHRQTEPLLSIRPRPQGYFRTRTRFPEQNFSRTNLSDACLGFWIAYVQEEEILSSNCLRARPNWMYQARSTIGNVSLMDLMIPGTHNTGTYASFNRFDDTAFSRYLITQEESVWNQLVYGIRYLDLRVAYRNSGPPQERFRITHSSFMTNISVEEVVRQVKDFLDTTKEVVIMDFHRFVSGFKGRRAAKRHQELIAMLENEVGNYMIPVSYTSWVNMNSLWDSGKRLYVGYADENSRKQNSLLFPAIKHLWGDVDTVPALKNYLNQTVCGQRTRRLTSAMAQLTPTAAGAIFNLYGGLRNMADGVNREVVKWFRDEWNHCANIVATDFFLGNNIIEIAIESNRKKHFQ